VRGRKPCPLKIAVGDLPILRRVARQRSLPWRQVQHARILLEVAAGQRVQDVARQVGCATTTVWRICRDYKTAGLPRLFTDRPPSSRPTQRRLAGSVPSSTVTVGNGLPEV